MKSFVLVRDCVLVLNHGKISVRARACRSHDMIE
jgi:hypothetical protein